MFTKVRSLLPAIASKVRDEAVSVILPSASAACPQTPSTSKGGSEQLFDDAKAPNTTPNTTRRSASDPIRKKNEKSKKLAESKHMSLISMVKMNYSMQLSSLSNKLVRADEERRTSCLDNPVDSLHRLLSSSVLSPHSRLVPVGSTVNGLRCASSDYDFVLLPSKSSRMGPFLRDIHSDSEFRKAFFLSMADLVEREMAKDGVSVTDCSILHYINVPLVIMKLSNGISVDIQVPSSRESFHAIRNTNLIRCYTQCDPRFAQLYLWVRTLCNVMEIKNSKAGMLSSYHIIMLVIHFLQSTQCLSPWTVLPIICNTHPHLVSHKVPIEHVIQRLQQLPTPIEYTSMNEMPVGELAVRFVEFYSCFDFATTSIRIGSGMTGGVRGHSRRDGLILLDPYSSRSVCSVDVAPPLRDAMHFVKKSMYKGSMIDSFPSFPETFRFRQETFHAPWREQLEKRRRQLDRQLARRDSGAREMSEKREHSTDIENPK